MTLKYSINLDRYLIPAIVGVKKKKKDLLLRAKSLFVENDDTTTTMMKNLDQQQQRNKREQQQQQIEEFNNNNRRGLIVLASTLPQCTSHFWDTSRFRIFGDGGANLMHRFDKERFFCFIAV